MIQQLFPYKVQLHIFQLDEYNSGKFLNWIFAHFWTRKLANKKPLVWTQKARAIYLGAICIAVVVLLVLTFLFHLSGFITGFLLATQAYIFLIITYYLFLPYERYQKNKIKTDTESKLKSLSHLKIIGITGSYGKTSVKEFLYQILRTKYTVLKTPESYNTPYGIAKVVRYELDNTYDYFVCEMGAYRRGEIKEICDMVHPQYGILTGINEQHIETFGSLENTTLGKFELIDSLPETGIGIANIDNERIRNHLTKINKQITEYGFSDNTFSIKDLKQTPSGSEFSLILDGRKYHAITPLLGSPNFQNILAAATMSIKLGMEPKEIIHAISLLKPVPHRLELKEHSSMTVIDDAYNSNVDGFKEAIHLLQTFERPTIFVTPGIVDLGSKTHEIHKELGNLLRKINYIILVGKSPRTEALREGIGGGKNIFTVSEINEVWDKIKELNLNRPVILLENDLPDNY